MNFKELDKVFIIAEVGVNHEGNFETAKELVRLAAESKVDAVKFQTFNVDNYVSKVQPERYERSAGFQLKKEEFVELSKLCRELGVMFFSTPLHEDDVEFLDGIVPLFKISSGDLTYIDLIKCIASKNKPIILSTGLGTKEEIQNAIDAIISIRPDIREKGELALMHCVAAYPTPIEETNLKNILWLKDTFGLPVGYSDHTLGIKACELSVAVGAKIIEKHFTYRKENQTFHDHKISADPDDMKQLVHNVRQAEVFLGKKERVRVPSEEKMVLHMRRSVGASRDIEAGTLLTKEHLTFLRPAWGVPVEQYDMVIGKKLKNSVKAGELIVFDNLE